MKRLIPVLILGLGVLGQASIAAADAITLKSLNLAGNTKRTRLIFDFSAPVSAQVSSSANQKRITVNVDSGIRATNLRPAPVNDPLLAGIRFQPGRFTFDLKSAVIVKPAPLAKRAHIEIELARQDVSLPEHGNSKALKSNPNTIAKPEHSAVKPVSGKRWVVAIDAGHGGKDTGAIGPSGTREKDVVFAMASKLAGMVNADPAMRAVMVRRGDEFIELGRRAAIARQAQADLFLSLHADAFVDGSARGSSVFTLSRKGASSEAARWLANHENAADWVGGVKLKNKNRVLASVLLDLSQGATMDESNRVALRVLRGLERQNVLHHRDVQKAGFVVLKSPDVPSLLIETGFISNPDEESKLRSSAYQERIARSIYYAIRAHVTDSRKLHQHVTKVLPPLRSAEAKPIVVAEH